MSNYYLLYTLFNEYTKEKVNIVTSEQLIVDDAGFSLHLKKFRNAADWINLNISDDDIVQLLMWAATDDISFKNIKVLETKSGLIVYCKELKRMAPDHPFVNLDVNSI